MWFEPDPARLAGQSSQDRQRRRAVGVIGEVVLGQPDVAVAELVTQDELAEELVIQLCQWPWPVPAIPDSRPQSNVHALLLFSSRPSVHATAWGRPVTSRKSSWAAELAVLPVSPPPSAMAPLVPLNGRPVVSPSVGSFTLCNTPEQADRARGRHGAAVRRWAAMNENRILFVNGQVFDGTGSPGVPADVIVRGNQSRAYVPVAGQNRNLMIRWWTAPARPSCRG